MLNKCGVIISFIKYVTIGHYVTKSLHNKSLPAERMFVLYPILSYHVIYWKKVIW